ncbi:MAG: 5'-methylthioadenosine/adenosylhomocysteine nucleosidase [Planctomycetes bacterium]|nr:5'-methylthioadenosine/adenosylhomocysteine nucleosidase [Planctomycetota bacterium]
MTPPSSGIMGIMGAMPEEVEAMLPLLRGRTESRRAGRVFHHGRLGGREVVVVSSRWGKVAAASTCTELIVAHGAGAVAFFGIAGAVSDLVARGDIVIAASLVQHDLDASPFFPPTHIPLLGVSSLASDASMAGELAAAARRFVDRGLRIAAGELWNQAGLSAPRVLAGVIASGDQVIFSPLARDRVLKVVPDALCVEMEGAAAAQVCHEHGVAFACVRTISDNADHEGADHVRPFFEGLAGVYTRGIVGEWLGH